MITIITENKKWEYLKETDGFKTHIVIPIVTMRTRKWSEKSTLGDTTLELK